MKTQNKVFLYAGLAIFFWSTVATAFKLALRYLNFLELLMYASITSLILLFFILLFQGKLHLIKTQSSRDLFRSSVMGLLNPFLYYIILFKAYSLLPAQVAQPLNMVWPIVLVFLSIPLLKQKVSPRGFIALFISFIGVYFISTQGDLLKPGNSDPLGVGLALGSSVIWSLFFIYNVRDNRNEEVKLFLSFLFATIFIVLTNIITGNIQAPPIKGLAAAIYTGCFEMGITFVFWLKALRISKSASRISIYVYLAPFLSLVFIHIFVGEYIYLTTIAGLVLIITGILVQKLRLKKRMAINLRDDEKGNY